MIPYERLSKIFEDIYGQRISKCSLVDFNKVCYENLESIEFNIKEKLIESEVIHCDETGIKINRKLHWTHVVSSDKLTYLISHEKRGKDAIDELGGLPNYETVAVHDFWESYDSYDGCIHAACNAHILRKLNGIPFTNNQAERDLRILKVSQKTSRTYRNEAGSKFPMGI